MPFNRRLRTLCTLRSSFATTCGTSAPQGCEWGKAPHLGAQSSGAARKACALLFHADLRHLSHAGRATGSGAESWRPIVAYVPCVRCAPLSRQPAAPQPRRGANGVEHRTSVLDRRVPHARRGTLLAQTALRHLSHAGARASWRLQLRLPLGGRFFLRKWHEKTCVY